MIIRNAPESVTGHHMQHQAFRCLRHRLALLYRFGIRCSAFTFRFGFVLPRCFDLCLPALMLHFGCVSPCCFRRFLQAVFTACFRFSRSKFGVSLPLLPFRGSGLSPLLRSSSSSIAAGGAHCGVDGGIAGRRMNRARAGHFHLAELPWFL